MPKRYRRLIVVGLASLVVVAGVPALLWVSVTHQPKFYKAIVAVSPEQRQEGAKRFLAQSLQLSNDIHNEPRWEAVFSDQEVNAWLAEDLVTHFADQLPPEVHEPRVVFEPDRVTLAFQLDQGPLRAVIWVVARVQVAEQNVLELAIEKIRAGVVPVPSEKILERITDEARARGLDIRWTHEGDQQVALIRYTPDLARSDVVLEQLHVRRGQIRLAGRSNRVKGAVVSPVLPKRKVLQSAFPRRNTQANDDRPPVMPTLRSSTSPTS
jgi:hypothetical protein